jgi:hypothetical protein
MQLGHSRTGAGYGDFEESPVTKGVVSGELAIRIRKLLVSEVAYFDNSRQKLSRIGCKSRVVWCQR